MRKSVRNFGIAIWLAVLIIWHGGLDLYSLVSLAILLGLGILAYQVETRTRRPLRSYGRLMVFSLFLFLTLVIGVATWGGIVLLGAIFWVVMTAMGTIWVVHYERTEPLDPKPGAQSE